MSLVISVQSIYALSKHWWHVGRNYEKVWTCLRRYSCCTRTINWSRFLGRGSLNTLSCSLAHKYSIGLRSGGLGNNYFKCVSDRGITKIFSFFFRKKIIPEADGDTIFGGVWCFYFPRRLERWVRREKGTEAWQSSRFCWRIVFNHFRTLSTVFFKYFVQNRGSNHWSKPISWCPTVRKQWKPFQRWCRDSIPLQEAESRQRVPFRSRLPHPHLETQYWITSMLYWFLYISRYKRSNSGIYI